MCCMHTKGILDYNTIQTVEELSSKGTPKRGYRRIFLFDTIRDFHSKFKKLGKFDCSKPRVLKNIPFRYGLNISLKVQNIR
jgi:hypothetical protein